MCHEVQSTLSHLVELGLSVDLLAHSLEHSLDLIYHGFKGRLGLLLPRCDLIQKFKQGERGVSELISGARCT